MEESKFLDICEEGIEEDVSLEDNTAPPVTSYAYSWNMIGDNGLITMDIPGKSLLLKISNKSEYLILISILQGYKPRINKVIKEGKKRKLIISTSKT